MTKYYLQLGQEPLLPVHEDSIPLQLGLHGQIDSCGRCDQVQAQQSEGGPRSAKMLLTLPLPSGRALRKCGGQ